MITTPCLIWTRFLDIVKELDLYSFLHSLFPSPVGVETVCYLSLWWCDGWLPQQLMNLILGMRKLLLFITYI